MIIGADELRVHPSDPLASPDATASDAESDQAPPPLPDAQTDATADVAVDGPLVEPDLVAAWFFDEASGTVAYDRTGHGHDGVLQGAAAFATGGVRGNAVSFNGGVDSVLVQSLNNAAFPRSGTLSVHFRYNFNDTSQHGVFDSYSDARSHLFIRRANNAPNDVFQAAGQHNDAGGYSFVDSFVVPINTWTHVVLTWNEASRVGNIYVNGVLSKNQPYQLGAFAPDQQIFRLGVNFIGMIDEIRLYDRAFSATEVAAIP